MTKKKKRKKTAQVLNFQALVKRKRNPSLDEHKQKLISLVGDAIDIINNLSSVDKDEFIKFLNDVNSANTTEKLDMIDNPALVTLGHTTGERRKIEESLNKVKHYKIAMIIDYGPNDVPKFNLPISPKLLFRKEINKIVEDHANESAELYRKLSNVHRLVRSARVADHLAYKYGSLELKKDIEKIHKSSPGYIAELKHYSRQGTKTKSNPIKKQTLSSGDIRIENTANEKFVIIKKEKKSYGVYPGGDQFKRVATPSKKAAIAKAYEILMRKKNPRPDRKPLGVKRSHETVSEVGEDIKELVVKLYMEGDSIERIARRVDLSQSLVKQVLAEKKVPVRKGGPPKVKPNPSLEEIQKFMTDVMDNIPGLWVKLRQNKFNSDEYKRILNIIMWAQGVFMDPKLNSYITSIMIHHLYDYFGVVEKDPVKHYKTYLHICIHNRPAAHKMVVMFPKKSFGSKSLDYFDKTAPADKKLYYTYMKERISEFEQSFTRLDPNIRLVDFTNILREFSTTRYSEKHDILIKEITFNILKRPPEEGLTPDEIEKVKSMIDNIHKEAMEIIARSKFFLEEYVSKKG